MDQRRKAGRPRCEICNRTHSSEAAQLHEAVYEAHHLVPLSAGQERTTRLEDMALLCANCHTMIHRAIAQAKRWLSIHEAKVKIFGKASLATE
ncbi:HNH endonuclease [Sorangium cellulosum]|uniref:HNH endonuclease n=1 Tax=Sorangium cellulosum TaxID=56 RepID=UPI00191C3228